MGRPEEYRRRFKNTQEQSNVKHQQVIGRNFGVGRLSSFSARVSRGDVSGLA